MKRVLVTDDNRALADNLAEILIDEGYDASIAYDPKEAIARVTAGERFDMVLLDVRLPGMDGVSLHAVLREYLPDATFVLMTAFSTDDRLDTARRAGVRDVLPKPVPIARLLRTLGHASDATKRLLVVDDDADVRDWLTKGLQARGFEVATSGTAHEARSRLLLERFDVAIVDVRLPDDDGLTLATEISVGRGIPVVVISGYDEAKVRTRLEQMACDHTVFLEKPFSADTLLSIVTRLERRP